MAEPLGDLILEMKLDDQRYRQQVKSALTTTVAQVKQASRETSIALNKGFDTAQASQGLRALQGSLYLVTGETGYLVIEAGRTAVALKNVTTASGGLTAALAAAAAAGKGFLASLGPIGWALTAAGAAYAAYKLLIEDTNEETARAKKETDELAASIKRETDARKERQAQIERETGRNPQGGNQSGARFAPLRTEEEVKSKNEDLKKASEQFNQIRKEAEDIRRQMFIEFGSRASDLMSRSDPRFPFQRVKDLLAERKDKAEPTSGFGFAASSGFRFGSGAFGSVIGAQQSEQKKTNDLLEILRKEVVKELKEIVQTLTPDGLNNFLGAIGLPGL